MNTDEAFMTLAKAYAIPEQAVRAQIAAIRGESGSHVSNLALVSWLREQAQKYERGMGAYGRPVRIETLSECALYRMAAERLEKCNMDSSVLDHIDRYAKKTNSCTWEYTFSQAEEGQRLKEAALADVSRPVAMA